MEQAPARANKTITYIASGAILGMAFFIVANPWTGIPLAIALGIGGYMGARVAPDNFALLKKDMKHLAASFVSHVKEDAGRFKRLIKESKLIGKLKKSVKKAKKKVQSVAASDTSVSKPLDTNASSKAAFTESATPGAAATEHPAAPVAPGIVAKPEGNKPA